MKNIYHAICVCGHSYENHNEDLVCMIGDCTKNKCNYYQEAQRYKVIAGSMTESLEVGLTILTQQSMT